MNSRKPLGLTQFDAAEYLDDEKTIAEFLNAAASSPDPQVLLDAFGAIARARGMADLAKKAGLGRESLYKALSPGAHPRYETIFKVAQALGVGVSFIPKTASQAKVVAGSPAEKKRASHTKRGPAQAAKPRTRKSEEKAVAQVTEKPEPRARR